MRSPPLSCLAALGVAALAVSLTGASYRTQNFAVSASSAGVAQRVGDAAEESRRALAVAWLGRELAPWTQPCPIRVMDDPAAATLGKTSYSFERGEAVAWEMSLSGPAGDVIEYVLPHEVMHTVLATQFGRPLPRWAEEGACTLVEPLDELQRHERHAARLVRRQGTVSLASLFATQHYPRDPIPFYLQSYSVTNFLIERGGRRQFLRFVDEASRTDDWNAAVQAHYGLEDLVALETAWRSHAASSGLAAHVFPQSP